MKLIEIDDSKIKLCSGLSEESFAKTRYSLLMGENGLFAEAELSKDGEPGFSFTPWKFDSIKSDEDTKVFYEGSLPSLKQKSDFIPLCKISEKEKSDLIIKAILQAIRKGLKPAQNGGGILAAFSENYAAVLFLPEELFYNSAASSDQKTFLEYYGYYKNPLLQDEASLAFMLSAISYKALTGQFPYANPDKEERISDIVDKMYLPLAYAVNGIDEKTAALIDTALTLTKDNSKIANQAFIERFSAITDSKNLQSERNTLSQADFEARKADFLKAQTAKIQAKRKIYKNSAKILGAAAVFAVLLLFVFSAIKTNADRPTTKGLQPSEVTECFFEAINNKDVQTITEVCKGNPFKPYINAVTNMHVANAASQAFTFSSASFPPEKWFFYATDETSASNSGIYGISNLTINGKPSLLDAKTNKKKQKPEPAAGEEAAKQDGYITQELSYYIVQNEPETGCIQAEYAQGTVTLSWIKNRWILTDIDVQAELLSFDTAEFKNEYLSALAANDKNVIDAAQNLFMRYPWIPSRELMENTEKELKAGF